MFFRSVRHHAATLDRSNGMKPLVCIVDDEPEICDILRIALETRDYRVISAHEGREGLAKILERKPDLVLLDVKMPGLNGYEILNRMRRDPEAAGIPVIILTSLTSGSPTSDAEWREKLDVADFVSKPFEPLDLVGRVQAVLEAQEQAPEAKPQVEPQP